jgi:hypothetical protein
MQTSLIEVPKKAEMDINEQKAIIQPHVLLILVSRIKRPLFN